MEQLSFVGTPDELMQYLTENCHLCHDEGVILKDEWTNTDDSYEVAVRCECNED